MDENKDNNEPSNLEQLEASAHLVLHMRDPVLLQASSERLTNVNAEMQLLAQAAKRGEYIGKRKLRTLRKGNKHRECLYCGTQFTLKATDKDGTKFCTSLCAGRHNKQTRDPSFKPLASTLDCIICGSTFTPVVGNQQCCGVTCQRINTENLRKQDFVNRTCSCGEVYETIRTSKRKYCSDACRKRSRASKDI